MSGKQKDPKVVVIGLDGATWKILMPWVKKGKLPFLKSLMEKGSYGTLESTIPPITAPAWVSFQTGVNPGKHGVFDFIEYDKEGNEQIVNSHSVKAPRIWEILEKQGKSCCIVNMPVTYPPPKTKRSIIVSSFLTPPGKPYTSPPEIQKKLDKIGYEIDIKFEKYGFLKNNQKLIKIRKKLFKKLKNITNKRMSAIRILNNQYDWDLFFILFKETDLIQHLFWKNRETLQYYMFLDESLKILYDTFENKKKNFIFLIVSDHGFHKSPKYKVSIYSLLKRKKTSYSHRYNGILNFYFENIINKISNKLYFILSKTLIDNNLDNARITSNGIYVDDLKQRNEFIKKLKLMKFNNKKVFKQVCRKDEIYKGKLLKKLPEIIFLLNKEVKIYINRYERRVFIKNKSYLKGEHFADKFGIFISNRKLNIKNNKNLKIYDILPIILRCFNIEIPPNIDGKSYKLDNI